MPAKPVIPAPHNLLAIEREVLDLPPTPNGWARYAPGPNARTTCGCGIDTGWLPAEAAAIVHATHLRQICPHDEPVETSSFQDGPGTAYYCAACHAHLRRAEDGSLTPVEDMTLTAPDLPREIPFTALHAACEALGLPVHRVRSFTADYQHVTVTYLLTSIRGQRIFQGDDALTATVRIPVHPEVCTTKASADTQG